MTHAILSALAPLAAIAQAYRNNDLDDEARRFWGMNSEHENTTPAALIELYSGRGGAQLLTLQDCFAAEQALHAGGNAREAIAPLVKIAEAYDRNELDDEARKTWGLHDEFQNTMPPEEIELYSGRGGSRLLTLADAFAAREAVSVALAA